MALQQKISGGFYDLLSDFYNGEISMDSYGNSGELNRYSSFKEAVNVDVNDGGGISKRTGYKYLMLENDVDPNIFFTSPYNQLWVMYFKDGGTEIKLSVVNLHSDTINDSDIRRLTITSIPSGFNFLSKYEVISYSYNEIYILADDVWKLSVIGNPTLVKITSFKINPNSYYVFISKDHKTIKINNRCLCTLIIKDIDSSYTLNYTNFPYTNADPYRNLIKLNVSENNRDIISTSKLNDDNIGAIRLESTNSDITIPLNGLIYDESTNKTYISSGTSNILRIYRGELKGRVDFTGNVGTINGGGYTQEIDPNNGRRQRLRYRSGNSSDLNVECDFFGEVSNVGTISTNNLQEKQNAQILRNIDKAIINHQRMIVFSDKKIYFSAVGSFDIGVDATGTPVNCQSIKDISEGEVNSITSLHDGIAYGSSTGVYFFKLDFLNTQVVPYLSFISSLIPIENGLFTDAGNLIVVTENGIFVIQSDDFVHKDVSIERTANAIRTLKITPYYSHVFKNGIISAKGFESNGEFVLYLQVTDSNYYRFEIKHITRSESLTVSMTQLRFQNSYYFSDVNPTCILYKTPTNKSLYGYKLKEVIYTLDDCKHVSYALLDKSKAYLDFYISRPIDFVAMGTLKYENSSYIFVLKTKGSNIPVGNALLNKKCFLVEIGSFKCYYVEVTKGFDAVLGEIELRSVSSSGAQSFFSENELLPINPKSEFLFIGKTVLYEESDIQPYIDAGVEFYTSNYDCNSWNCAAQKPISVDSNGIATYDVNSFPHTLYACIGLPYDSYITLNTENYHLENQPKKITFMAYATPTLELIYGNQLTPTTEKLNNQLNSQGYYNISAPIMSSRIEYHNTIFIQARFGIGLSGNINEIMMEY